MIMMRKIITKVITATSFISCLLSSSGDKYFRDIFTVNLLKTQIPLRCYQYDPNFILFSKCVVILSAYLFCLEVYMCTMCMLGSTEVRRRHWISWDCSHRFVSWCGVENWTQVFCKHSKCLKLWAISPALWLPFQRCKLGPKCVKTSSNSLPSQPGTSSLSCLEWEMEGISCVETEKGWIVWLVLWILSLCSSTTDKDTECSWCSGQGNHQAHSIMT